MSLTKEDIINAIAEMSVKDVVELVSAMEEKFGVSAAAAVGVGGAVDRHLQLLDLATELVADRGPREPFAGGRTEQAL